MTEDPREDDRTAEAPVATPAPLTAVPGLQTLDLGLDAAIGMVCDIDDPDCNPMAFAGTSGASMTGGDEA